MGSLAIMLGLIGLIVFGWQTAQHQPSDAERERRWADAAAEWDRRQRAAIERQRLQRLRGPSALPGVLGLLVFVVAVLAAVFVAWFCIAHGSVGLLLAVMLAPPAFMLVAGLLGRLTGL